LKPHTHEDARGQAPVQVPPANMTLRPHMESTTRNTITTMTAELILMHQATADGQVKSYRQIQCLWSRCFGLRGDMSILDLTNVMTGRRLVDFSINDLAINAVQEVSAKMRSGLITLHAIPCTTMEFKRCCDRTGYTVACN
jgi:hypothetical protein